MNPICTVKLKVPIKHTAGVVCLRMQYNSQNYRSSITWPEPKLRQGAYHSHKLYKPSKTSRHDSLKKKSCVVPYDLEIVIYI